MKKMRLAPFGAQHMEWRFTIYPPKQVLVIYAYSKNSSEVMREAVEENLPLIEICISDYKKASAHHPNPQR